MKSYVGKLGSADFFLLNLIGKPLQSLFMLMSELQEGVPRQAFVVRNLASLDSGVRKVLKFVSVVDSTYILPAREQIL